MAVPLAFGKVTGGTDRLGSSRFGSPFVYPHKERGVTKRLEIEPTDRCDK